MDRASQADTVGARSFSNQVASMRIRRLLSLTPTFHSGRREDSFHEPKKGKSREKAAMASPRTLTSLGYRQHSGGCQPLKTSLSPAGETPPPPESAPLPAIIPDAGTAKPAGKPQRLDLRSPSPSPPNPKAVATTERATQPPRAASPSPLQEPSLPAAGVVIPRKPQPCPSPPAAQQGELYLPCARQGRSPARPRGRPAPTPRSRPPHREGAEPPPPPVPDGAFAERSGTRPAPRGLTPPRGTGATVGPTARHPTPPPPSPRLRRGSKPRPPPQASPWGQSPRRRRRRPHLKGREPPVSRAHRRRRRERGTGGADKTARERRGTRGTPRSAPCRAAAPTAAPRARPPPPASARPSDWADAQPPLHWARAKGRLPPRRRPIGFPRLPINAASLVDGWRGGGGKGSWRAARGPRRPREAVGAHRPGGTSWGRGARQGATRTETLRPCPVSTAGGPCVSGGFCFPQRNLPEPVDPAKRRGLFSARLSVEGCRVPADPRRGARCPLTPRCGGGWCCDR